LRGNPRRDDWYDPLTRELFHEQVSQIGLHRIQRKIEIRNSLLNVVLYDRPAIRKRDANRDSFPRLMAGLGVTIEVWSAVSYLRDRYRIWCGATLLAHDRCHATEGNRPQFFAAAHEPGCGANPLVGSARDTTISVTIATIAKIVPRFRATSTAFDLTPRAPKARDHFTCQL
jgi:hypothetical protein